MGLSLRSTSLKERSMFCTVGSFSANSPSIFDHMDWFMCNVLIDHSRENVVGVLDWEKAGFIPDPEGSFLAGADESVKARLYLWLTLFDSR